MDLLNLARGPLLGASVLIFVLGMLWRTVGLIRRPTKLATSAPRRVHVQGAIWATVLRHMLPRAGTRPSPTLATLNPYFYHLGLAFIVFGYAPHIAFLHRHLGVSWPALPDAVMYLAAGVTIISLLVALAMRLMDPTLRRISSADDYISWGLLFLVIFSGMALIDQPSSAYAAQGYSSDPTRLAIHLMSLELLLVWFPFGKLFHTVSWFFGRAQFGAFMARRGVRA
jgi:nitrate reductase gamma subunit